MPIIQQKKAIQFNQVNPGVVSNQQQNRTANNIRRESRSDIETNANIPNAQSKVNSWLIQILHQK